MALSSGIVLALFLVGRALGQVVTTGNPAGIPESPIPGRSGATTMNFSASLGMIGLHMREVCV